MKTIVLKAICAIMLGITAPGCSLYHSNSAETRGVFYWIAPRDTRTLVGHMSCQSNREPSRSSALLTAAENKGIGLPVYPPVRAANGAYNRSVEETGGPPACSLDITLLDWDEETMPVVSHLCLNHDCAS